MYTDGDAAFPRPISKAGDLVSPPQAGMTLLDYFAAKAMQGELAAMIGVDGIRPGIRVGVPDEQIDQLADHWYRIAAAMIKARRKAMGHG